MAELLQRGGTRGIPVRPAVVGAADVLDDQRGEEEGDVDADLPGEQHLAVGQRRVAVEHVEVEVELALALDVEDPRVGHPHQPARTHVANGLPRPHEVDGTDPLGVDHVVDRLAQGLVRDGGIEGQVGDRPRGRDGGDPLPAQAVDLPQLGPLHVERHAGHAEQAGRQPLEHPPRDEAADGRAAHPGLVQLRT